MSQRKGNGQMSRLLGKDEIADYAGDYVWIETKYDMSLGKYEACDVDEDGQPAYISVKTIGDEFDLDCKNYDKKWRLWDAYVTSVSAKEMEDEPWDV